MATSTKWRINVSSTGNYSLAIGRIEFRTAVGVPRPFVLPTFSVTITPRPVELLGTDGMQSYVGGPLSPQQTGSTGTGYPIVFGGDTWDVIQHYGYGAFGLGDLGSLGGEGISASPSGSYPPWPHIDYSNGTSSAIQKVYTTATSDPFWRMRVEANKATFDQTPGGVMEMRIYHDTPNLIKVDFGETSYPNPVYGVGDGIRPGYIGEFPNGVHYQGYDIVSHSHAVPDGVASASSTTGGVRTNYLPKFAAYPPGDGRLYWSATGSPGWWQYEYNEPVDIKEVVLTAPAAGQGISPYSMPQNFTIEMWDAATSTWKVADTRTGVTDWTAGESRTFAVTNAVPIVVGSTGTGNVVLTAYTASAIPVGPNPTNVPVPPASEASGGMEAGKIHTGQVFWPLHELEGSLEPALLLPVYDLLTIPDTPHVLNGTISSGDIDMLGYQLAGGFDDGMDLQTWDMEGIGHAGALSTGIVNLEGYTLDGSMEGPLAYGDYALSGVMLRGAVSRGDIDLPVFELDASFGTVGDVRLSPYALTAAGITGGVSAGAVTLPRHALAGNLVQDVVGAGNVTLPPYALIGTMLAANPGAGMEGDVAVDAVIDGSITLPAYALVASAATGATAVASLTLPLYALDAEGYADNIGHATIELPAFLVGGSIATAGVGGTTEPAPAVIGTLQTSVALNTRIAGVTLYEGVHANSYANFAGVTLAATPAGIVALTGHTDLGRPIAAHVLSGVTDFDSEKIKRVLTGYVGFRSAHEMDLTLITDEHHEYVYRLEPRQDSKMIHASRVKFGRGVDGRYWQWRLANRDGGQFSLDDLRLTIDATKRGI